MDNPHVERPLVKTHDSAVGFYALNGEGCVKFTEDGEKDRINTDDLRAVAADNGFQDWHSEYDIAALDVDYLVQYRGSTPQAAANNALIRAKGYTQRWMSETSYSTVKRTQGLVIRQSY